MDQPAALTTVPRTGDDWFASNLAAIQVRLAFLYDLPDGAIHKRPGTLHNLVVWKEGTFLELHFHGGKIQSTVMEVISDLDFARPLFLVAGFTQAMMLGLLWMPDPQRVYVLGFGAGRVPMVLHHHFPEVQIESAEIDPDVIAVARQHFGIQTDDRLKVAGQEGRAYLAKRDAALRYDIIMVDAFRGLGFSPVPLATKEFYQLCRNHLSPGGVLVVNWMRTDFLLVSKMRTLLESFASVLAVPVPRDGTIVLFASDTAVDPAQLALRAEELQAKHGFASPFVEIAQRLADVKSLPEYGPQLSQAKVLRDGDAPVAPPPPVDPDQRARVGRNDPCPCGSGKKYKKCHGQTRAT